MLPTNLPVTIEDVIANIAILEVQLEKAEQQLTNEITTFKIETEVVRKLGENNFNQSEMLIEQCTAILKEYDSHLINFRNQLKELIRIQTDYIYYTNLLKNNANKPHRSSN